MQSHAGSFDFILDTVSATHDVTAYLDLLKAVKESADPQNVFGIRNNVFAD